MTVEQRAEEAAKLKQSSCNCCQAVLAVLADQTGLDEEQLLALGSGFGSGMGNMEATCGALVGAAMAGGLKIRTRTSVYSRRMSELFAQRCGATHCGELKGRGTGKMLCSCEDCVRNAVRAYAEVVGLD